MDEELEPKKIVKDNELANDYKKTEEQKNEEIKDLKKEKRKSNVGKIISRIIWTLIFVFVIFEVVIGILNMQRLNDDKEPIWYFSSSEEKEKNKTETRYNLGLYVIVKTVEGKETQISLKPFFLK